jgi:hypothetical protein
MDVNGQLHAPVALLPVKVYRVPNAQKAGGAQGPV